MLKTSTVANPDDQNTPDRVFTLAEASGLLPQLRVRFTAIRRARAILVRTSEDVKRASAKASSGGGSTVGPQYVTALQEIGSHLQAIHELGVVIKDVNMGLFDFPFMLEGRIVYLCWKFGEPEIRWWHEVSRGYMDRFPLEESTI